MVATWLTQMLKIDGNIPYIELALDIEPEILQKMLDVLEKNFETSHESPHIPLFIIQTDPIVAAYVQECKFHICIFVNDEMQLYDNEGRNILDNCYNQAISAIYSLLMDGISRAVFASEPTVKLKNTKRTELQI